MESNAPAPQSSQNNQNTLAPKSELRIPEKQPLDYVVRPGDSLTQLARKGDMTAAQLAAANDLSPTAKLQVGQKLVLPTPLGADVSQKGPADQAGWRSFERNGYTWVLDEQGRTRTVEGELKRGLDEGRSKQLQRQAGGSDRLQSDDGGHFIAPRFEGPREAYNHFAQDRNFNRGTYRNLENRWQSALEAGQTVKVSILADYSASSHRPAGLMIQYIIGKDGYVNYFGNQYRGVR